jgi:drug/metabolite transporter (DMT)-like permease
VQASTVERSSTGQIWTALSIVYVVWGSTYLGIAILIESMPPLLAMGSRFLAAGSLMAGYLMVRSGFSVLRITRRELLATSLVAFLLLGIGLGGVTLAEAHIPSGLAAMLVAATPLWVVILRRVSGERPSGPTVAGVLVGFAGLAVLVLPGGWTGGAQLVTVGIVMVGTFCWALGTFLSGRLPLPRDARVLTCYEMLCGSVILTVLGALHGEHIGWGTYTARSIGAWFYLVLIGSLVGFTAFVWVIGHAPISLASTYAYVNPVVAVLLGVLILSEPLTRWTVLGGGVVVVGVSLVVRGERPPAAAAETPVIDTGDTNEQAVD